MLEELSDYALVKKPKDTLVNGNVLVKNSPDTQFGDRYYWNGPVTLICPTTNGDSELALKPGLLESAVAKSNGFQEKTDNNNEVCITNEKKFKVRRLHILAGALALVLLATVATLIVVFAPSNSTDNDDEDAYNKSLKIVTRGEWFALPPSEVIHKLEVTPAPYVVLFSTESSACFTETICGNQIRSIQAEHFRRGFGDIGYNFLIGGDGAAYTGLGWDLHGAHTLPLNNRSIGVAVIGYFQKEEPPKNQIRAFWKLMEIGVKNNKITANYTIFTHRDVVGSQSPGIAFYKLIKTWPHYKMYDPKKDIPPYTF